jgi:hypothetical protein
MAAQKSETARSTVVEIVPPLAEARVAQSMASW